jgi:LysM repeat protein
MEEDVDPSSGGSMLPLALALLAVVLGAAGLYFGLNASQRLTPLVQTVDEGSSATAAVNDQLGGLDTRLSELRAQLDELAKTVDRLRVYGSQSEQLAKQAVSGVRSNREEMVRLASAMEELAQRSVAAAAPPREARAENADSSSGSDSSSGGAETYVIQSGDTFGRIADRLDVSLNALLDANPDADPRRLRIGQEIVIPGD